MPILISYYCKAPPLLPGAGRSSGHVLRRLHCRVHGSAGAKCLSDPMKIDAVKKSSAVRNFQIVSRRDDPPVENYHKALTSFVNSKNDLTNLQEMIFHKFGKAFILANIFVLAVPNSALAEICEQNNSLFNMPVLFAIAMIGATVGGLLARQRKGELKKLNEQLRQINAALRRQAKIESYAPALSYAPVGATGAKTETEIIIDPRKEHLLQRLRTGKNHLRNQDYQSAFEEFKTALDLAGELEDHVEEKKAARGLGASLQRQGKYKDAIKYHCMVLNISEKTGEDAGLTEAYGAIADCYTELGELEQAGKFYDKYIARLEKD